MLAIVKKVDTLVEKVETRSWLLQTKAQEHRMRGGRMHFGALQRAGHIHRRAAAEQCAVTQAELAERDAPRFFVPPLAAGRVWHQVRSVSNGLICPLMSPADPTQLICPPTRPTS